MGATGLIYEPLYQFDLANPTKQYPWLATAYKWGNDGKAITFTIRTGVKWSNGTALTPADVAFTYDYIKKNTAINLDGLDITSVTTSGDTVTVNFPTAQYTNLENIAGRRSCPSRSGARSPTRPPSPTRTRSAPARTRWAPSRRKGSHWSRTRTTGRRAWSRSPRSTSRSTPRTPAR